MIDTTAYRFRTAVGGFHKQDVTDYIAKSAAQHQTEVKSLRERIEQLEKENEDLKLQVLTVSAFSEEPEAAPAPAPVEETVSNLELQAYRRAEATERLAHQRAQKLYRQLEEICHTTCQEFDSANDSIETTVAAVLEQTKSLRSTYETLSSVLKSSQELLASMEAMVPDPAEALEEEAWLS